MISSLLLCLLFDISHFPRIKCKMFDFLSHPFQKVRIFVTVLLTLDVVVVGVRLGVEEVVVRVYWLVCLLLWLVLLVFIVVFYSENWLVFLESLVA